MSVAEQLEGRRVRNNMEHFTEEEFSCKCGACDKGFNDMVPELIDKIQVARHLADTSFKINSAIRCEEHNKAIGGSPTSSHMTGHALDISCDSSRKRFHIVNGLLDAGFTRVLLYPNFIHTDVDHSKDRDIITLM